MGCRHLLCTCVNLNHIVASHVMRLHKNYFNSCRSCNCYWLNYDRAVRSMDVQFRLSGWQIWHVLITVCLTLSDHSQSSSSVDDLSCVHAYRVVWWMEEIFFWSGTYQSVIINLCVPFHSKPSKMSPPKRKTLTLKENILKEVDEKAQTKGKYVSDFNFPDFRVFI